MRCHGLALATVRAYVFRVGLENVEAVAMSAECLGAVDSQLGHDGR